jgi:hypothetical protein
VSFLACLANLVLGHEPGKIRFGDKLVTPNYDLTGKMP